MIIPVLNEERSIGKVLDDLPREWVNRVVVVDNGSTDQTAKVALENGAIVLQEPERGYGAACLKGINFLRENDPPKTLVFIDGDYSDNPSELPLVAGPVEAGEVDVCIGSRTLGKREKGAMMAHQLFGNWLSAMLIRLLYGLKITDLGPFRAVNWQVLESLQMEDRNFGWTVELQAKVAKRGLRYMEVPVSYKPRIGQSKITGSVQNSIKAGVKIIYTIFKLKA